MTRPTKWRLIIFPLLFLAATVSAAAWSYLNGWWIPNARAASKFSIRGIDVSHHQGAIDWAAVGASGIDFVYMKATEGGDFIDSRFAENWNGATHQGIARGAYHFFSSSTPGHVQARHFLSVVPVDRSALPPVIDLEFAIGRESSPPISYFRTQLDDFLAIVREAHGREPVIYTTYEFYNHYLVGVSIPHLWIRDILFRPRNSIVPAWTFWQYSNKGRIRGISTFVDLNVFGGDWHQFELLKNERSE